MTGTLYAEVAGKVVPLTACDWVLWKPCGCARAVAVACLPEAGQLVADEAAAWKEFYDRAAQRKQAAKDGMRVELVTHERWRSELMESFGSRCPHKAATP